MYEIIFRNHETDEELIAFAYSIKEARIKSGLGAEWEVEHCDYID